MSCFDYGDNDDVTIEAISGLSNRRDEYSHTLNICNNSDTYLKRNILTVHVAHREWISQSKSLDPNLASSVCNIEKLRNELSQHIKEVPCLIIHYGDTSPDFASMMRFGRELSADSDGEIPIVFVSTGMTGNDVISRTQIADALLKGITVIYRIIRADDMHDLGIQMSICATKARETNVDISHIRVINVIDKAGGFILSKVIRDDGDDRAFFTDDNTEQFIENRASNKFELATRYMPQVESIQETPSTMMNKEWTTRMSSHAFRNAHYPSSAIHKSKFPLDQLGFILSYHPFGMSYVIAVVLLPEKGNLVKQLLESWVNTLFGTPTRFIRAK